ncbi:hypothetical protein BIW11_12797, partial [Tropilaelaps mercedesae]
MMMQNVCSLLWTFIQSLY